MTRLEYTREEILADPEYASRIRRGDVLFHGGLDAEGRYLSPRSRFRAEAIERWTAAHAATGAPTTVMTVEELRREFFPTVAQAKLLLRNGAKESMTRILTLIGITEGFGNDGLRPLPPLEMRRFFREPIDGTCLDHLFRGLLEAHGNDEAGRGDEAGHDAMWYAVRDEALGDPEITPDMYENLPIAPPPGYTGPAKPAPEAIGTSELLVRLFPTLDPVFEIELSVFTQLLAIELSAYTTFAWAREVLSDPECSAAAEWAPWMVDCVRRDEDLHVGYLQVALSEARARTMIDTEGRELPGREVVDAVRAKILRSQGGPRLERMLAFRMRQIRAELAKHPTGEEILDEFARLGPVPA